MMLVEPDDLRRTAGSQVARAAAAGSTRAIRGRPAGSALFAPAPTRLLTAIPPTTSSPADSHTDCPPADPAVWSDPVRLLVEAVALVREQAAAELPAGQALAETAMLLALVDTLTAVSLSRLADVRARELHTLAGAPSTGSWVESLQVGVDRSSVALANKLRRLPAVAGEFEHGRLSLPAAVAVGRAVDRVRPWLDRPDGLLDGEPQQQVLTAVIVTGVLDVLGQARGGWPDDHPELTGLQAELTDIAAATQPAVGRVERAFVVAARSLPPAWLSAGLGQLVDALLPEQHDNRVARAHRDRGVELVRDADGAGWRLTDGRLDLECGELLHLVLTAQHAIDPANPADTVGWQAARAAQADDPAGWVRAHRHHLAPACAPAAASSTTHDLLTFDAPPGDGAQAAAAPREGEPELAPRSRRQQQHDALKLGLRQLLASGGLGSRDKTAPQLLVTVSLDQLQQVPGALPATTSSGSALPRGLLGRLFCDSRLTRVVLSAGRRVLELSHAERTLKAHERTALNLQWGGRCAAAGCTSPPGSPLIPHHATPWHLTGTTALTDSVPFCQASHHDLHDGGHTLRLRDGRHLSPTGWVASPPDRQ